MEYRLLKRLKNKTGFEAPAMLCCHWPCGQGQGPPGRHQHPSAAAPYPLEHPHLHATHSWPLLEHVGFSSGLWGAQGGAALPGEPAVFMAPGPACCTGASSPRLKSLQVTLETLGMGHLLHPCTLSSALRGHQTALGSWQLPAYGWAKRVPAYHVQARKHRPAFRLDHPFHLVHGVPEDELHATARRFRKHLAQIIQLPVDQTLGSGENDSRHRNTEDLPTSQAAVFL